ncbi:MAG TPA: hypothetical protein VD789_12025, partial [Thermomicrobiales bacterium]|nr:hypothetical protein [Thermomicrobiales bacterium]
MVTDSTATSTIPDQESTETLVLWERTGRLAIELDGQTGLPTAMLTNAGARRLPLRLSAMLVTEGDEVDRDPFGLAYANTTDLSRFTLASRTIPHELAGYDELYTVSTSVEGWGVDWEYRFRGSSPRLELQVVLSPTNTVGKSTLRNLHFQLDVAPPSLDGWLVEAPGAQMRSSVPAGEIVEQVSFSESTFSGSGILVLHQPEERAALLVWPFSRTEHSVNRIQSVDGGVRVLVETGVAGR